MFISVYNLFYTSLPVLALGVFEQDVSDKNSVEYPRLYTPGLKSELFNIREFIYSVLHGAFTSLILFLIPYGVYKDGVSHNGYILSDHMTLGAVVATILIVDNTAQVSRPHMTRDINFQRFSFHCPFTRLRSIPRTGL